MKREAPEGQSGRQADAHYANYFHVGLNAFEVEFGQHYDGGKRPLMHMRIIAAPFYAKALLGLLTTAIANYEASYAEFRHHYDLIRSRV